MNPFSISELARIIKAETAKKISGDFIGVSTDSRTIKAGDCFFAVSGENFDGHNYIDEVFAKGAACAVVSKEIVGDKLLRVDDTIKSLGTFAAWYRTKNNFKVVAITGSVGKTTAREIIYHVLSQRYRTVRSPKSFNNNIGLPLTLLGAKPDDQIIVAELGSNHPGEIEYLTKIAQPDIAVITTVQPAHLEGFGNLDAITQEKLSIATGLKHNGIFIINADCPQLVKACHEKNIPFTGFGTTDNAQVKASNIKLKDFQSSFTLDGKRINMPLPGRGNIENALAAWAVCENFGITIDDFAQAIKILPAVSMRTELLKIGTITILNDCYNANPASMKNALEILANLYPSDKGRKVFICGDMGELGTQSEQLHTELGQAIAKAKVQLVLAVGKYSKIAAAAAKAAADYDLRAEYFDNVNLACNRLDKFIKDYDIILVKGSRVVKLELAVKKLSELFSEMIYHLLWHFRDVFTRKLGFYAYQDVTFRSLAAVLTSFLIAILLGPKIIRWLIRKKIGDKPEFYNTTLNELTKQKANTPTMGGLIIILALVAGTLLWAKLNNPFVQKAVILVIWFGALGAVDDWLKLTSDIRQRSRDGLKVWEKLIFQIGGAVLISLFLFNDFENIPDGKLLWVPFYKHGLPLSNWLFILIAIVYISATSNAVNLTDGMDGLASGCLAIVSIVLALLCYVASEKMTNTGSVTWASYLLLPPIQDAGELSIFYSAITGAVLGFLWYNCHPAQAFMGDVGSLPLGAAMGYGALVTRNEILLLLIGGVFMMELVSVVLQVGYFKFSGGKRIFRCAPIHHHFHLLGWSEPQVVVRFWLLAAACAALAIATLKLR